MSFINRSLLSIRKRFSRSVILFIAVLLICNVMAGAISIKKALEKTEELYGNAMPIVVSIEEDYLDSDTDNTLSPNLVTELGNSVYVKKYRYYYDYYLRSKSLRLNDNIKEEDIASIVDVEIKGSCEPKIDLIESGTLNLIDGRLFTEEEIKNESNVVIVSKEVATYNGLNIGDTIKLGMTFEDKGKEVGYFEEEYTVVGIVEAKTKYERDPNGELIELSNSYLDVMFMPNEALKNIHDKIIEEQDKYNIKDYDSFHAIARYYLTNKDDLNNFKNENMAKLPRGFTFADNSKNLTSLEAPIQNMEDIANTIVYASIIVSIVVIGLIIILFVKERKQEMGIYLALGERKKNIALQILFETLIVAFIGISISIFTGNMIAKNISSKIVENQLVEGSNNQKSAYGDDIPKISEIIPEEQELEIECNVTLDIETIIYIYVIALSSITLSTIIPISYTLKLNPRKILM